MKFGLTGNPLGHSLSKVIHTELFKLKNLDSEYELYPDEKLENVFKNKLSKLNGFNVTIPYKTDIIDFVDECDDKVKLYNSCNTVVCKGNKLYGYNTDVYGFLNSIKRCGISLENKRVLVLGSGGVSRMMAFECVLNGSDVYICSRNYEKCNNIKTEIFNKLNKVITVISQDEVDNNFDIVLNGTPCGMYPNELNLPIPFSKIKKVPFIFDTIYNPRETLLTRLAKYCGNKAENGLFMLVEQGAVAQKHFMGIEYSIGEVEEVTSKIDVNPININKNIVLIGPPGSGKTTVGMELAEVLNLTFVDIDAEIEKKHGNITTIFDTYGEKHFRNIESEVLLDFAGSKNLLISTGGGVVESKETMLKLCEDKDNIVMFINPSFDILLERTTRAGNRPLLRGNIEEKLRNLLDRRLPLYNKYCNVKLDILKEQDVKKTVIDCVDKVIYG
ncbi:MAG: shikimate dehydrogenase [Clostridia bacterium]|nr:shikimate dehydrogenase [Clostridia bacterium]